MIKIENAAVLVIDFQERLMPSIHNCKELERNTEIFIKGCKLLDVPILVTQQYTKGLGDTLPSLKDALGEFTHIEKMTFSCCQDSDFNEKLSALQKRDIIVTGIEAHICVQQTVLELIDRGYNIYVAADCIGSRKETARFYAEQRMKQAGSVITTMESVLFELMVRADHPKRKQISELVK